MTCHAIISGASIAGPAVAKQLNAHGWRTTVLERAPCLRPGGQNVDLTGIGREVARQMGVEEEVRAAGTGENGVRFIGDAGQVLASIPVDGRDLGTKELEILRGELSRILYEGSAEQSEYRFGCSITDIRDRDDHVEVVLSDGGSLRGDVVVIAEGLRSRTRDLVFPEATVRELGVYSALLTIPRDDADEPWWDWNCALRGRSVHLRPDNVGTTRAMLAFHTEVRGLAALERDDQVALLRSTFADVGWMAPRVLDALDAPDFYFDGHGQALLPRWSTGRVTVVGDAAYCASPASGRSTTLALTGAYILAEEIARADDPRTGMRRYEELMRPLVDEVQKLRPGTLRFANPQTRWQRAQLISLIRIIGHPLTRRVGTLLGDVRGPRTPPLRLPDYSPSPAGEHVP